MEVWTDGRVVRSRIRFYEYPTNKYVESFQYLKWGSGARRFTNCTTHKLIRPYFFTVERLVGSMCHEKWYYTTTMFVVYSLACIATLNMFVFMPLILKYGIIGPPLLSRLITNNAICSRISSVITLFFLQLLQYQSLFFDLNSSCIGSYILSIIYNKDPLLISNTTKQRKWR